MKLVFVTDTGEAYNLEVNPQMEIGDLMALLEAECDIPTGQQSLTYNNKELSDQRQTLSAVGLEDNAMIALRRKVIVSGRSAEQDAEMMRLQILGDPNLMRQLKETQPEIAHAVQHDPQRFAELLRQTKARQQEAELARQREIELLNSDPFDVEAQKRIEELIQQQAVLENMEHAMEYSPESFGRVTMLYIPLEVNSVPVKAFVDSGAQQTIMSPECAEKCGIMRLLDRRFSGIARGVGTAKILGRIHSAQLKLGDLHLACSFTVMEGKDVDLLFGLDMLKAHQACIDLEKNVLRIQGREIKFLAEHELPDKARMDHPDELADSNNEQPQPSSSQSAPPAPAPAPASNPPGGPTSFAGTGNVLGGRPQPAQPGRSSHPEDKINALVALGATRAQAIQYLDAAGGNVDVAAGFLF
jgi:DNA damage-inducible protein 1